MCLQIPVLNDIKTKQLLCYGHIQTTADRWLKQLLEWMSPGGKKTNDMNREEW
jgi:hypothetical protein